MNDVRKVTNELIELAEVGCISWQAIAMMALKWMSEDDVKEMCVANEVFRDLE